MSDHDRWERAMSSGLDRQVRDLHEAPLSLGDVQGAARSIRRRRRLAVAGGVLAAAAVVVPVSVAGSGVLGPDRETVPPATAPASPTRGVDPTPSERTPGSLGVAYLEGSTLHTVAGGSVELETAYVGGTALGDRVLAVRQDDQGRLSIDTLAPDGEVLGSEDALSYPVGSTDGGTAAYVAADGGLAFERADGAGGSGAGSGLSDGDSVAAVGGPGCTAAVSECVVYVNHGDGRAPEVVDQEGGRTPVAGAVKIGSVAADGRIAAQTSSSDTGSCSAVLASGDDGATASGGPVVWDTCEFSLFDFSPGGGHLWAADAYLDGLGPSYVSILDATDGSEVARYDASAPGYVREAVWEDDEHLLVNAYEDGEWRVHRLGLDGSTELVLTSPAADEMTPAYLLLRGAGS